MATACAMLLASPAAQASPPPWADAPYSYYANNESLRTVLGNFAGSFSLALEASPEVSGNINGKFNAQNPTEFMDRLGSVYGLNWFTHAGTLFVSRTTEMSTKAISSGSSNIAMVREALGSLGLLDKRFGWGELPEQGVALVSGPPAYVGLIERTMATLPLAAGGQQVAVFKLKHASVDDRTIMYRDRQITTPGLAQVLRNLINNAGSSGSSGVSNSSMSSVANMLASSPGMAAAANTAGMNFDPNGNGAANGVAASPYGTANATGAAPSGMGQTANGARAQNGNAQMGMRRTAAPSIQADSRLNAIIVQDTPERIPLYKALIDQLDVATPLIEIEALIIDVNTNRLDELGIAWSGRKGGTVGGFGNMTPTGDGNDLIVGGINRSATFDPTTLVVNTGNFLVSRIRALETNGDASIQSRPSILTVDNTGALLDLSETFYVRTIGERVATVTPITAGTTLRVTPHFVMRDGGPVVQLDVDIEDGQIQETTVDTLPTVRRSTVSTQAIVGEGQTLLIGGYRSTSRTSSVEKVPGLGSVPILGLLFSNRTNNSQIRERLFMIRPRVVSLPPQLGVAVNALKTQDPFPQEMLPTTLHAPAPSSESVPALTGVQPQ
ncbi:type III secretion system outer membrane ring subunit SctC [Diaphorobacter sp. NR2-3-3-1]|nr:type III secretion system outer membrane ring subunit SctC [Diaphorobacter caeni]